MLSGQISKHIESPQSFLIIDFSYEKLIYLQDKQANKHKEETREINFQNPKKVPI